MRYVFITGMGRSGTSFLAQLLSHVPDLIARHEYIGHREFCVLSWCMQPEEYAVPFLERERACIDRLNATWFVDVNSYLRHSVEALTRVFQPAAVFHLVRDPRDVVRSIYLRRDDRQVHITPKGGDPLRRWLAEDKFFRVCWNWADTTERLVGQGTHLLQFERLTSDYSYLRERLLDPFEWDLSEPSWRAARSHRTNRTRGTVYRYVYARLKGKAFERTPLPLYPSWTERQKAVFQQVCGPVMGALGYELD